MSVILFDGGLTVKIFYDETDSEYEDAVCIQMIEDCPEDEKVLKFDETNLYITPDQACLLILALQRAMDNYRDTCQEP
ncbi:MAG: hypothetical protein ACK2T4_06180 [Candidatus Promineifilaceae bacterium]|jgi:hypothetical protein